MKSRTQNWNIFLSSFIAFILLNTIENILHYNIGRTSNEDKIFDISLPTKMDTIRIFVIMIIFAGLQGLITILIQQHFFSLE